MFIGGTSRHFLVSVTTQPACVCRAAVLWLGGDGVGSGVASAGYANSPFLQYFWYLFMLISGNNENTRLGPSVLLWASC